MDLSFACGSIAGRSEKLLNKQQLSSFKNLNKLEFLELLKVHQYGFVPNQLFEVTMLEEETKHKLYLESILNKNHLIFKVLYINFNQLFLANLIKSFQLGIKFQSNVIGLSTYDEPKYIEYLLKGIDKGLDLEEKEFIDELVLNTKDLEAQDIADYIIKRLNSDLVNSFTKKTDKFIIDYYSEIVTIQNVLLLIRSKRYNRSSNYIKRNLLEGGKIGLHIINDLYSKSFSEIGEYLKLHFDDEIVNIFRNVEKDNFMSELSTMLEQYLVKRLVSYSFENMNFAPIIYFTTKKRYEITQLKQLYYHSEEDLGKWQTFK